MEEVKHFCTGQDVVLKRKRVITSKAFSFSLPERSFVAFVGKNGAGKTTLLHAILGEHYLESGSICLERNAVSTQAMSAKEISQIVSFVPQEHSYPSHFTGSELLRFSLLSKHGLFSQEPREDDSSITAIVETLDLGGLIKKTLAQMSSGERQKMFLASALIKKPRILILDEPTNHLDPSATNAFWKTLDRNTYGSNVILSTHDLGFIESSCDYVVVLDRGDLYFAGPTKEFLTQKIPQKVFQL